MNATFAPAKSNAAGVWKRHSMYSVFGIYTTIGKGYGKSRMSAIQ
jgi:hypothetical protein